MAIHGFHKDIHSIPIWLWVVLCRMEKMAQTHYPIYVSRRCIYALWQNLIFRHVTIRILHVLLLRHALSLFAPAVACRVCFMMKQQWPVCFLWAFLKKMPWIIVRLVAWKPVYLVNMAIELRA